MEDRIIEALTYLGFNENWLLTGNGNISNSQVNNITDNKGIAGIQGNENIIKDKLTEIKRKKRLPKWVYWVWLISIIAIGFSIAALFIRVSYNWSVEVVSTAIILGFVGILATFVVIGNYMQVKEIKDEFENKVNEIDNKFKKAIEINNKNAANYAVTHSLLSSARGHRDIEPEYGKQWAFYYYQKSIVYASKIKIDTSLINEVIDEFNTFTKRLDDNFKPILNTDVSYNDFVNALDSVKSNENAQELKKFATGFYNKNNKK